MRANDATGQATAEYAALLALVAAALLGAGAAVGLDDVGTAVAATVRTGICIVAGDICRDSDAAAAGLEPCTVGERSEGGGTMVSIAWLRIGEAQGLTVATRSDGSVLVTRAQERTGGAGAGLGIEASPLGLEFGVDGSIDFTVTSGSTWEFADATAAARFLADEDRDRVRPTWRFGDAGEVLTGKAGAKVGGATLTGVEASARGAAGARVGRGSTTLYVRARLDSSATAWLPGRHARVDGPSTGDVMVELTLADGGPREIAFRRVGRAAHAGQVVDTVARLDLRDPANRRAAAGVLAHALPWPPSLAVELRSLARLATQRGVVERAVYDMRDDSGKFEIAARLGLQLGVEVDEIEVQRRLVAASAWTHGSQERLREDCVM
jgi:hypothetical protein